MPLPNLITGNDGSNNLQGGPGDDVIYGFNPDGPQGQVSSIAATRVASGLSQPLFAAAAPGDLNRLFVVEKTGLVRILDLGTGQVLGTPFLDVTTQISTTSESGLLGLAFHPNFAANGLFYVNLINTSGDTEIRRYRVSGGNANQADPGSASVVIAIDQPAGLGNHKAGWLGFDRDGYLYAALGDGGGGGDPQNNGQNVNSLLGKMLRLDVDADAFPGDANRNYAIPADNPFLGTAPADEIWALGLRNPWRDSFDRALGTFYIADVGQNEWEEVDIGASGANYGWKLYEGPDEFSAGTPSAGTLTFPIHSYDRSVGSSITGGYVYRGESEGLHGHYFFADFVGAKTFTLHFNGSAWVSTERTGQIVADAGSISNPSSFGEDARGNLYLVDFDGDIFRLTPLVTSADQGDTLGGGAGRDMLFGGSGNDVLDGGADADTLRGGRGNDTLAYTGGFDTLDGGPDIDAADFSGFGSAVWVSLTYPGVESWTRDRATLSDGPWRQIADLADVENFTGTSHDDYLGGDGGANVLGYTGGFDVLNGNNGTDTADFSRFGSAVWVSLTYPGVEAWTMDRANLSGGTWRTIADLASVENLVGTNGADYLGGDAGANVLGYTAGFDVLNGDAGTDTADFSRFGSAVWVSLTYPGAEAWTRDRATLSDGTWREIADLASIENFVGTNGADYLGGDAGANVLGYTGGFDVLNGDAGTDTADFSRFGSAVWVSLTYAGVEAWTMDRPDLSGTTWRTIADLAGIENIAGTAYDDYLGGDGGANVLGYSGGLDVLNGDAGVDTADFSRFGSAVWVNLSYAGVEAWTMDRPTLSGGPWRTIADLASVENVAGTGYDDYLGGDSAANRLDGATGADTLHGGAGNDLFLVSAPEQGADTVDDFLRGADLFALENTGFGIAGTGTLASQGVAFVQGSSATSGNPTVLFDPSTSRVSWDGDGTGAAAAQLLATLVGITNMSAGDFTIM